MASHMEMTTETDRYNNTSDGFANDMSVEDTAMPVHWEHDPNWDSYASVWNEMIDPGDASKASGKKRKKQAHDSEPQSSSWLTTR
jgi:hypothetical protein